MYITYIATIRSSKKIDMYLKYVQCTMDSVQVFVCISRILFYTLHQHQVLHDYDYAIYDITLLCGYPCNVLRIICNMHSWSWILQFSNISTFQNLEYYAKSIFHFPTFSYIFSQVSINNVRKVEKIRLAFPFSCSR